MAMNKQRKSSNLLNILNYDDAGNIVLRDYSQTIRYNWNGTIHAFTGPLSISSIAAAVTDTDRFLVSDGGVLKYRTGAEVLSDIGGVPSTRTLTINGTAFDLSADRSWTIAAGITGSGVAGQVAYWNGTSSQTGSATLTYTPTTSLLVNNSVTAASAIARGTNLTPTLTASANSDVLVGLDINPTFTNGAFTGVTNTDLRIGGNVSITNGTFSFNSNGGTSNIFGYGSSIFSVISNANGLFNFGFSTTPNLNLAKISINNSSNTYSALNIITPSGSFGNGGVINWVNGTTGAASLYGSFAAVNDIGLANNTGNYTHMFPSGNVLIGSGTRTDGGFKLDVNGTARVSGAIFQTMGTNSLNLLLSGTTPQTTDRGLFIGSGNFSNASFYSTSVGIGTTITGTGATAIGFLASATNGGLAISHDQFGCTSTGGIAIGRGANSGSSGLAIQATANGGSAIAIFSNATGSAAISIGSGCSTTQPHALSIGDRSIASGRNSIALGFGSLATSTGDFVAGGLVPGVTDYGIYNVYFGSGKQGDGVTPLNGQSYTINGSGGLGTNFGGGTITIAGGKGTGSGASGDIVISTATPTTSGTTLQTLTERFRVFGNSGNVLIQNGGTFTDAGFRLDVNGTARVSGNTIIVGSTNASTSNALTVTNFAGNVLLSLRNDSNLVTFVNGSMAMGSASINSTSSWAINLGLSYITGPNFLNGLNQYFASSDGGNIIPYMAGNGANGLKIEIQTTSTFIPSALLQVNSTTKGFLQPRLTTVQRDAIASPATGLSVYNTTTNTNDYYNGTAWISGGINIYNSDGTLTADRTVTSNGNSLTILGGKETFAGQQRALWLKTSTNTKSTVELVLENTFPTTGKTYEINSDFSGAFNIADRTSSVLRLKIDNTYFQFHSSAASNANLLGVVAGINALWFNQTALTATTANYTLCNSGGITLLNAPTGGEIRFRVGNAERMMLTNAGRLLLGTTTESTFLLDVNGTARVSGLLTTSAGVVGTYANFSGNAAFGSTTQIAIGGSGGFGGGANYWLQAVSNNFTINVSASVASSVEFIASGSPLNSYTGYNNALSQRNVTMGFSAGLTAYYNQYKSVLNATGNASANTMYVRGYFVDSGTITPNSTTIIPIGFENVSGNNLFNSTSGSTLFGAQYTSLVASAKVQIDSTTQGFLPPRMTTTQKNAISSPVAGLQVYDSTTNAPNYYNGTAWVTLGGGGTSIYTADGTLTSNRTVSSGGFSLVFNPQTAFVTTLSAAPNDSTTALVSQNTLSYASGFFSTNIGNVYGAVAGINLQTFAGSATFETANLATAVASVNRIDFSSSGSTITMTQPVGGGIRAMTGHQSQIQYQGTNSGTITHAAISQNLGFYRPSASTGILTITNAYSLLINDLNDYTTGFTFTNRWAIYQDGASDNNYFKGKVVIGSTNTVGVSRLNVKDLPTSATGLATGDVWNNGGVLNIV